MKLKKIHVNKQLEQLLCSYYSRSSFQRKGCYVYKIQQ